MGKFPGKPSKFVNKKRIQVGKCVAVEVNNSAKNAENIYNGLAVFYKVFGSDEQIGEFHGFSSDEVVKASKFLSVLENKRPCNRRSERDTRESARPCNGDGVAKSDGFSRIGFRQSRKQCFDGGGGGGAVARNELRTARTPFKHVRRTSLVSRTLTVNRTFKNDVAKKILDKAKKASHNASTLSHQDKTNPFAVRKFVLPSRSAHSSRVIKPNKRFLEGEEVFSDVGVGDIGGDQSLKKLKLEFLSGNLSVDDCPSSSSATVAKLGASERSQAACKLRFIGLKEFGRGVGSLQRDSSDGFKWTGGSLLPRLGKFDLGRRTFSTGAAPQPAAAAPSSGSKVILRKARLKLDTHVSRSEGSFTTISKPRKQKTPGTVMCSVCGAVRFYRFVQQARKFGVLCCESCRKFVSKMIRLMSQGKARVECHSGNGMCRVPSVVRSQQWRSSTSVDWHSYQARCPACWLQMCLRAFSMPLMLQKKLMRMLPHDMQDLGDASPSQRPGFPPILFRHHEDDDDDDAVKSPARNVASCSRTKRKAALASRKTSIERENVRNRFRSERKIQSEKKIPPEKKVRPEKKIRLEKKVMPQKKIGRKKKLEVDKVAERDKRKATSEKRRDGEKRPRQGKTRREQMDKRLERKNSRSSGHLHQLNHLTTTRILKKAAKNLVKVKGAGSEELRQQQLELKGPRVKHVCRSASIVLGQPQATFPLQSRPDKRKLSRHVLKMQKNKSWGSSRHCTKEDVNAVKLQNPERYQRGVPQETALPDVFDPAESCREPLCDASPILASRKAAKPSAATILPPVARILPLSSPAGDSNTQLQQICVDFWESYDPEEVCNTGFALIGSEPFHVRAVCFLCGSAGHEKVVYQYRKKTSVISSS